MKGFTRRQDVVVQIRDRKATEPPPLYPLAREIGELRATTEKLLYRIQQCERREKDLLNRNGSLRRELSALKNRLSAPAAKRSKRPAKSEPSYQSRTHPPEDEGSYGGPPDFGGAIDELNPDRH